MVRALVCFLLVPWLPTAGAALRGDFRDFVVGWILAALVSGALGFRGRRGIGVAVAYALVTAVLSIIALVIAFRIWIHFECGDRGFDAC
jgi:hypothetical protein